MDYAVGPGDPEMLKYFWAKPENDIEKYLCKSQVCRYYSRSTKMAINSYTEDNLYRSHEFFNNVAFDYPSSWGCNCSFGNLRGDDCDLAI